MSGVRVRHWLWALPGAMLVLACGTVTSEVEEADASAETDAAASAADAGERADAALDACDDSPCENDGACTADGDGFTCDCDGTGYEGDTCDTDIDECAIEDSCAAYADCNNEPGTYTCTCQSGFSGDPYVADGCCFDDDPYTVTETTATDPETGLVWERDMEPGDYTWALATDRCASRDLRLPTSAELESIVDERFDPTWMPCTFRAGGDTLSTWTATEVGSNSAEVVHFSFGGTGNDVKTNRYGVRCVHP